MGTVPLINQLKAIVGNRHVLTNPSSTRRYRTGFRFGNGPVLAWLLIVAFTALYDACVLYPAPVRDVLMHLALADIYHARWTNAIQEEWIRSVLKNRPDLTRTQLERTRDLMNAHARDALIQGFEDLIAAAPER
jgi:hypothetical protein